MAGHSDQIGAHPLRDRDDGLHHRAGFDGFLGSNPLLPELALSASQIFLRLSVASLLYVFWDYGRHSNWLNVGQHGRDHLQEDHLRIIFQGQIDPFKLVITMEHKAPSCTTIVDMDYPHWYHDS